MKNNNRGGICIDLTKNKADKTVIVRVRLKKRQRVPEEPLSDMVKRLATLQVKVEEFGAFLQRKQGTLTLGQNASKNRLRRDVRKNVRKQHQNRLQSVEEFLSFVVEETCKLNATPIECCICWEDMFSFSSDVRTFPCKHMFHTICINRWLAKSRTCPMCRADL